MDSRPANGNDLLVHLSGECLVREPITAKFRAGNPEDPAAVEESTVRSHQWMRECADMQQVDRGLEPVVLAVKDKSLRFNPSVLHPMNEVSAKVRI